MKKTIYILTLPLKMFLAILIFIYLCVGFIISWIPLIIIFALKLAIGWKILSVIISLYLLCLWFVCLFNAEEVASYALKLINKEDTIK